MVKADPVHERAKEDFVRLVPSEAKRRMGISDYRDAEYVSSEVLAAVIRIRYGAESGVLDVGARLLYGRVVALVCVFFHKNPKWGRVLRSSSETKAEAVSYIWEKLLADSNVVSLAETRFVYFVDRRLVEYLRGRLALKNTAKSLDEMSRRDEEGRESSYVELIQDESIDWPESAAEKAQTKTRLMQAMLGLDPLERQAVYLHIVCELDWKATADYLRCSVTTAKKHLSSGLDKLRGVMV
jgi:RNA polymerase sigma factor (sigma-70 family)